MRVFLILIALAGVAHADTIDMGKWDCSGSPARKVLVAHGAHDYVWHGQCNGAEGFDVEVHPARGLITKMTYDAATQTLVLHVVNRGKRARRVKLNVFVGFA